MRSHWIAHRNLPRSMRCSSASGSRPRRSRQPRCFCWRSRSSAPSRCRQRSSRRCSGLPDRALAAPAEFDALRRIAVAVARTDAGTGHELGKRLARLCAAAGTPAVPLQWPRRTAGTKTRVVALVDGEGGDSATVGALSRLAPDELAITFVTFGTPNFLLPEAAAHLVLPAAPDAAGKAIAALDPDVLVDFAGMTHALSPGAGAAPGAANLDDGEGSLRAASHRPRIHRFRGAGRGAAGPASREKRSRGMPARRCGDGACVDERIARASAARPRGGARGLRARPRVAAGFRARALLLRNRAARRRRERVRARRASPRRSPLRPATSMRASRRPTRRSPQATARRPLALCDAGLRAAAFAGTVVARAGAARSSHEATGLPRRNPSRARSQLDMADGETHYNHGVALQMQRYFSEAARAYQRALAFRPDLVAAHFNLGVLFQEQGDDRCGDCRLLRRCSPPIRRTLPRTGTWAKCCSPRVASTPGSPISAASRRSARRRCRSRCRRSWRASTSADFARLERYLDGLRQERFAAAQRSGAGRCAGGAPLSASLLRCRARAASTTSRSTYDVAARHATASRCRVRRAGARDALRIGYLSGDLRNHVMGKMIWQAVEHHDKTRFELFFYSLSEEDDEWTASSAASPTTSDVVRLRDRARRSAAHRGRRSRHPGRSVDAHQGRAAGHPRAQARARADHARRERRHGRLVDDRLQADRRVSPTCPENQALSTRAAAADGRLRVSRIATSRRRPSIRSIAQTLGHRARHRRHRRVRQPAQAVAPLPGAVARRAGAHPAGRARVLAGQSGAARGPTSACWPPPASRRTGYLVPAAGTRRRGEPGALRARRLRARPDAVRRRQRHARSARHGRAGRHAAGQAPRRAHVVFDPRQSRRHRDGRDERHANTSTSPCGSPTMPRSCATSASAHSRRPRAFAADRHASRTRGRSSAPISRRSRRRRPRCCARRASETDG